MKRLIHAKDSIRARTSIQENNDVFTIKDISELLLGISELSGHSISIKKGRAGIYKVTVGESEYTISHKPQTIYGEN